MESARNYALVQFVPSTGSTIGSKVELTTTHFFFLLLYQDRKRLGALFMFMEQSSLLPDQEKKIVV